MLDVSGITSANEALRVYYVAINEDGYKLTQDDLNYLRSRWDIDENDLDVVEYETLSDEEVDVAREAGKEEAREATGNDGKTFDDCAVTATTTAIKGVGAGFSIASISGVNLGALKGGGKFLEKLSNAFGKGTANSIGKASAIVGFVMAIAAAVMRLILKPNEENNEVLLVMQEELQEGASDMSSAQSDMQVVADEILAAQEEAENANESGQGQINDIAGQMYEDRITIAYLQGRKDAGETLSAEEEKSLAAAKVRLAAAFETSEGISDGIVDTVGGYQALVLGKQGAYDEIQVGIEELVGKIEFTANIDETTKVLANIEQYSAMLNMASLGIAGARMFQFGPWVGVPAMVLAGVAIGMELKSLSIQNQIINNAKNTIDTRTNVTDVQQSTGEMLDVERQGAVLIGEGLDELNHDKIKE